jgi:subtilisin family serine protease
MFVRAVVVLVPLVSSFQLHAQSKLILEANPDDVSSIVSDHHLTLSKQVGNRPIFVVKGDDAVSLSTITSELNADPRIVSVEPNLSAGITERQASLANASVDSVTPVAFDRTTMPYFGTTVRTGYIQQPAATVIRLSEAQLQFGSGAGIVAIIDTGVDPIHPVLAGALVPGYDFTRDTEFVSELLDLDPLAAAALTQSTVAFLDTYAAKLNQSTVAFLDQSTVGFLDGRIPSAFGHGTMVAGLVHLIAPSARIMPLKAFRADGTSRLSDIIRAIYYAVDHGAKVINLSFSINGPSAELTKALNYAASQGVICVASAGNMGKPIKLYPAGNGYVIGVGSTNIQDVRSSFSNYDVSSARTSAPGEALITTYPGNHYAAVWGTSFSTALVSGGVDLMRQARPGASISVVKDAIDHGMTIEQQMGDARLELVRSLQYLIED